MRSLLFFMLAFVGCAHHDKSKPTQQDLGPLIQKAAHYIAWAQTTPGLIDGFGFPTDDQCDAVQRACYRYVGGAAVNYQAAQDPSEPGRWYRDSARSCGPGHGSQTGFSRDMALGLGFCLWQAGDVTNAKAFLAYAAAHNDLTSPDGGADITKLGIVMRYLFKTMVAKGELTPMPDRPADPNPDNTTQSPTQLKTKSLDILTGYNAGLVVTGIYWDGLMHGGVSDVEMAVLRDQAARQHRNALFQAFLHKFTDGDQQTAIAVASDEKLFPSDRLPTSCDRSASYLWERDVGPDWEPGAVPCKVWSGTDLIFLVAILSGQIRGDHQPQPPTVKVLVK